MSRSADHLPHHDGPEPHDGPPPGLPRQRVGTTPGGHGRYPDFDVLVEVDHWDEVTRRVVLDRVERTPPIRFFDEAEAVTLGAFCDTVLAQDREPRVPVLAMVDEKLHADRLDGYRYVEMPSDRQTWREVARRLDAEANRRAGCDFAAGDQEVRDAIVGRFSKGELGWEGMPVDKAWSVVTRMMISAFYSHPWAWNEIGFGGPAYPREHWEKPPEFEVDPARDVKEREIE
jgi:hypothetical protein